MKNQGQRSFQIFSDSITHRALLALAFLLTALLPQNSPADDAPADPGWPRVFKQGDQELAIYQPQIDYWHGYTNIHYRAAIAVKGVNKDEKFGVVEVDAVTAVDQVARTVALVPVTRDLRFANTTDAEATALRSAVDALRPMGKAISISLDRVVAALTASENSGEQSVQRAVKVNLDPPKIFYSSQPAILVIFLGEPVFKPVATNRTDLEFALNSNWDCFRDTASQQYFLLNQNSWLTASDVKGPWTPAGELPASLLAVPDDDNWLDVRQHLSAPPAANAPTVFVSTMPAELILTDGKPQFVAIPQTQLQRVTNSDSLLFRDSADKNFYFLVAGRWFRAASLNGPWSAASRDLPADFARIPDDDPAAFVLASVPGTQDARDAVLLASVPETTTVYVTNETVQVIYDGQPKFAPIENSPVRYAVNSPYSVLLCDNKVYCCDQGVWFVSDSSVGPWTFCTNVPDAIYNIPASCPVHNVTYAGVAGYTADSVEYYQTAGYCGEYVADDGVLVFGSGEVTSDAAVGGWNYYCYPAPIYYSYGCGAIYSYGYGGYYSAVRAYYGPYGGAGYATAYNPVTGVYSRGAYAYGSYASGAVREAYNPYTGTRAIGAAVETPNGFAARGAVFNPATGQAAWGGARSTGSGAVGGVRTSSGAGAVAWNTANSGGAMVRTGSGDVYAGRDGTVYRRDANGGWSRYTGSGWQNVPRTQPVAQPYNAPRQAQGNYNQLRYNPNNPMANTYGQNLAHENLQAQAQARARGNQQAYRAQSWNGRPAGRAVNAGGYRAGGGRRR